MTEVPEHLRKRAEEARAKAAAAKADAEAPAAAAEELSAEQQEAASKIPAHLLERSKAAKAAKGGGDAGAAESGGGVAVQDKVASVVQAAPAADHQLDVVVGGGAT